MSDMKNIGAISSPFLTPRANRKVIESRQNIRFIMPQLTQTYTFTGVAGSTFYYKSSAIKDPDGAFADALAKTPEITSMLIYDNKILVFPHHFYFDISHPEKGIIPIEYTRLDTVKSRFKSLDSINTIEASDETGHIKWADYFQVGDSITITSDNPIYPNNVPFTGETDSLSNSECIITKISNNTMQVKVLDKNGAYKDFNATTESVVENRITFALKKPSVKYAAVLGNRLATSDANTVTIARQGSYNRFYSYSGDVTDSWTSNIQSAGDITALYAYNQTLLCMKNQSIHELYGTGATNYSVPYSIRCGCIDPRSVCQVGQSLFYLASDGVYEYRGVSANKISSKLKTSYLSACAGTDGRFYYLSAYDGTKHELMVYDTESSLWYKEDDAEVIGFSSYGNKLYAALKSGTVLLFGDDTADETFEWYAVTKKFGDRDNNLKKATDIIIRSEMEKQSHMEVYIKYDDGEFTLEGEFDAINLKPVRIPVRIKPCSTYQIKLKGYGKVCVREIEHRFYNNGQQFFNEVR